MTRTRIASGIYQDRYGLAATVKCHGVQREKRFPRGTPLETLRSWQTQTRALLDSEYEGQIALVRGTLEHDGDAFIERKKGQQAYKADRSHLRAWYPTFGSMLRSTIFRADVDGHVRQWVLAGVAARTIRHRCRVLRECYRFHDGPRAKTPVDHLKLPAPPAPRPVAVPAATIRAVATKLAASTAHQTYARFLVRATTGQRPAQIMRATPADVDVKRRIWFVRSAKGGTPIAFPLNAEAVQAWRVFAKADAWGPFDTGRDADVLRRYGWPADVPPYALRSTFAIDLLLGGATLGDVQGLLGHKQIQTTRSHYAPIQHALLRKTVNKRTLRLPATPSQTTSRDYQPTTGNRGVLQGKSASRRSATRPAKIIKIG